MLKEFALAWAISKLQKKSKTTNAQQLYKGTEKLVRDVYSNKRIHVSSAVDTKESQQFATALVVFIIIGALIGASNKKKSYTSAPKFGEYLLYLLLSKKDRENLIGDLEEEYLEVQVKFGYRAASLWYYKQVVTSILPLIRKAVGWGLLASLGAWIRRYI